MNSKIEVGDIVRIGSDPTEMTVDYIGKHVTAKYYEARCTWLGASQNPKFQKYNLESLVLIRKKADVKIP
jgi:hypothetical protein